MVIFVQEIWLKLVQGLTGLPQDVALLRIAVELFGKLVGLAETVEQEEKLIAAQVDVHAILVVKELFIHERIAGYLGRCWRRERLEQEEENRIRICHFKNNSIQIRPNNHSQRHPAFSEKIIKIESERAMSRISCKPNSFLNLDHAHQNLDSKFRAE